jgi:hypothetical protein
MEESHARTALAPFMQVQSLFQIWRSTCPTGWSWVFSCAAMLQRGHLGWRQLSITRLSWRNA